MHVAWTKPELAIWRQFAWGQLGFNAFDWGFGVTEDAEWVIYEFGPVSASIYK